MDHGIHPARRQRLVRKDGQAVDAGFQEPLHPRADDIEGEPEHQRHNPNEHGKRSVFARKHPVDPLAAQAFPALGGLSDRGLADPADEREAHIRHSGAAIQTALCFHLHDDMLQHLFLVPVEVELFQHERVALDHLPGGKAHRDPRAPRMVVDQVDNGVDAAMHRAAMVVLVAEILPLRAFLILGYMDRMIDELVNALVFRGGDRQHGHAEHRLHPVHIDGAAVARYLVHHVQRHHHRHVHFHELHGEIEVPLDVRGVHDVDDRAGLFVQHEAAGYDLLA